MMIARRTLMVAAVVIVAAACTPEAGSSRAVAEAFLDAHYVRIDLDASRELCAGLARSKVDKEIELTSDVEIDASTKPPRINYRLEEARETPGYVQYAYELSIRAPGLEPFERLVTLTVRDQHGEWAVTNFNDSERP